MTPLLLLLASTYLAPTPIPFRSVLWARYDAEHYEAQARAWSLEVSNPCAQPDAWFHYFKYAQYANRNRAAESGQAPYSLARILEEARAAGLDTNSFAYNYMRFAHEPDLTKRPRYLRKAHLANPLNLNAYTGLIAQAEIEGQLAERNHLLRVLQAQKPLPPSLLEYNYNQLESTEANAILITNGDADTFPSWVLQQTVGHRTDVRVVNLALLLFAPEYRKTMAAELEIPLEAATDEQAVVAVLRQTGRPVYFAQTTKLAELEPLQKEGLFVTGLTLRYGDPGYRNLSFLRETFEQRWRLDNLRQPLSTSAAQRVTDHLNRNYLPALLELRDAYREDLAFQAEVDAVLLQIAERAGVDDVLAQLSTSQRSLAAVRLASAEVGLSAKQIFAHFRRIPAGEARAYRYTSRESRPEAELVAGIKRGDYTPDQPITLSSDFFMSDTEVSHGDYMRFVQDLVGQQRNEYLDIVLANRPNRGHVLHGDSTREVLQPYDADALPVVNVSHEAAELYAQWLTEVYNSDPKRKDQRNIRFRLPTQAEWTYAALGGSTAQLFPWGGPRYYNDKGCLLGNFRTTDLPTEDRRQVEAYRAAEKKGTGCETESEWLVPVQSYYPNDYGLYNLAGNAAELLSTPGAVVGGSILDSPYASAIGMSVERPLPHPTTGFRLLAEFVD